jgi:phage terminase large subunit-like protein
VIAELENPPGPYGVQDDGSVIHYPFAYIDAYHKSRRRVSAIGDPEALAKHQQTWADFFETPIGSYRPLPVARRFHQSQAQFRAVTGGNRSSKSLSLSREVFWYATGLHPWRRIEVPNTIWYATVTHDLVGSILWEHMKGLLENYEEGEEYKVIWRNRAKQIPAQLDIKCFDKDGRPATSRVIFKSYEEGPRVFQGTSRRLIAFDEQFDESIWLECVSRIGAECPLDMVMGFTPIYSQAWLEEKLQTVQENWDVFAMPIDDNRISQGGFIKDEAIDALIEEWPPEVQPTRRRGRWGSFLGAVYKSFNREIHVVRPENEKKMFPEGRITSEMHVVGGIDWGGANPFVFLLAVKLPHLDGAWYFFDEYYWPNTRGMRLIKEHAEEIQARIAKWKCGATTIWADHDPTVVNEMRAAGVRTRPARKDKDRGIEAVQTAMKPHDYIGNGDKQPHFFVSSRCENTIRELATYKWSEATKKNDAKNEPVKKDDHTCDVCRYIIFSESHASLQTKRMNLGASNRRVI